MLAVADIDREKETHACRGKNEHAAQALSHYILPDLKQCSNTVNNFVYKTALVLFSVVKIGHRKGRIKNNFYLQLRKKKYLQMRFHSYYIPDQPTSSPIITKTANKS